MKILEVRYDDEGNRVYLRDGEEISESEWMQQHPHMRGQGNGRDGSTDSGRVGNGDQRVVSDDETKEQLRQGIRRQRAKVRAAGQAQRAGSAGDELGQSEAGPEQA